MTRALCRGAPRLALLCVVLATACVVPELDLTGKACDEAHPCIDGYSCVEGACVKKGGGGGDTDAGSAATDGSTADVDGGGGACTKGMTRACGKNVGECRPGTQTCGSDGMWGACTGGVVEGIEICDGKDNDCDGQTDEGLDDDHDGYGPAGTTCPKGTDDCDDHDAARFPGNKEICDGKDNDCNQAMDDNVVTTPCELTKGVCSGAKRRCISGREETVCAASDYGNAYESVELSCDGKDNNCDGRIDELLDGDGDGYGPAGTTCGKGTNDCDDKDAARFPGNTEICDGKDNNCNNTVDEGFFCALGSTKPCTTTCGTSGTISCKSDCSDYESPMTQCAPPAESCNGIDDNCSGTADEGLNSGIARLSATTTDAHSPAILGLAKGGFAAAYQVVKTVGTASTFVLNLQQVNPDGTGGASTQVASTSGNVSLDTPAVSSRHVAWLETDTSGGLVQQHVRASTWASAGGFTAGTPFDVTSATSDSLTGLVGMTVSPSNSLVAWQQASAGAPETIRVAVLADAATLPSKTISAGGTTSVVHPAFGTINGAPVLYYSSRSTNAQRLAMRSIDASTGTPGTEILLGTSTVVLEAAGAPDAVVYTEVAGCAGCNNRRRIQLGRVSGQGTAITLGKLANGGSGNPGLTDPSGVNGVDAHSPTIVDLGANNYLVAWLEASAGGTIINALRASWDTSKNDWVLSLPTGLSLMPSSDILSVVAGSDPNRFGLLFETQSLTSSGVGSSDVRVREMCPF